MNRDGLVSLIEGMKLSNTLENIQDRSQSKRPDIHAAVVSKLVKYKLGNF